MLGEETVRRRRWPQDAEFLDLFGAVSVAVLVIGTFMLAGQWLPAVTVQ